MTVRLDGRVVLVTGATAGIGRGISTVLAERGASVVGMARRAEPGEALAKEIDSTGGKFTFVAGDITKPEDCQAAVQTAIDQYGRIDVLINNAAHGLPFARVEDITVSDWRSITGVTLDGVLFMSQAALRPMQAQGDGAIISIASVNGVHAIARTGAYSAAKAAVIHLMRMIAVENVDRGVRANAVVMGAVLTEHAFEGFLDIGQSVKGTDWMPDPNAGVGRLGYGLMEADNVARALALLCSDDGREINGGVISIDRTFSAGSLTSDMFYLGASQQLPA